MKYCLFLLCFYSLFSQSIDVVIPVHKKDKPTLEIVIASIRKNVEGVRRVIVISKEKFSENAEWVDERDFPFTIKDVADQIGGGGGIGKNVRRGWYYQQLLKLYAHAVIDDLLENILIFDADTMANHQMKFIEDDGSLYMDVRNYGSPFFTYFTHLKKILPDLKDFNRSVNPVVHHMVFNKEVIEDLLTTVEMHFQRPFWKVFCNMVIADNKKPIYLYLGASEYTIYYHFSMKYHKEKYTERRVVMDDDAALFADSNNHLFDFSSVHQYDRTE